MSSSGLDSEFEHRPTHSIYSTIVPSQLQFGHWPKIIQFYFIKKIFFNLHFSTQFAQFRVQLKNSLLIHFSLCPNPLHLQLGMHPQFRFFLLLRTNIANDGVNSVRMLLLALSTAAGCFTKRKTTATAK
jgi:hypothetical protein